MSEIIKINIPGKPEYVQMVKLAIASVASNADFSMEAVEDIKIAVAEACKNITCHGFEGFSLCYDVECEVGDDSLIITVSDCGCSHGLKKDKKPCYDCPNDGNLAIHVIRSIMDKVETVKGTEGNKSIKMVKNRC